MGSADSVLRRIARRSRCTSPPAQRVDPPAQRDVPDPEVAHRGEETLRYAEHVGAVAQLFYGRIEHLLDVHPGDANGEHGTPVACTSTRRAVGPDGSVGDLADAEADRAATVSGIDTEVTRREPLPLCVGGFRERLPDVVKHTRVCRDETPPVGRRHGLIQRPTSPTDSSPVIERHCPWRSAKSDASRRWTRAAPAPGRRERSSISPTPETPLMHVNRPNGISQSMSSTLWIDAPRITTFGWSVSRGIGARSGPSPSPDWRRYGPA